MTSINISDTNSLADSLLKLKPDTRPSFGIMTPQHMIEHLTFAMKSSNGKAPQHVHYPPAVADRIRASVISSDNKLPLGFKSPILPKEGLAELSHPDLFSAIEELLTEVKDFHHYFQINQDAKPVNPTIGELNHQEWIIFHNKHFEHHFEQFRLAF